MYKTSFIEIALRLYNFITARTKRWNERTSE